MKKLNKKGFVLVETLIVTAFVVTLFILLYQNVVPFIGEYETMNNYDDIDSIYAANLLKQNLLRYGNFDTIAAYLDSNTYLNITDCSTVVGTTHIYKNKEYCEKLKTLSGILDDDYIYITKYNLNEFKNVVNSEVQFDSGKLSDFRSYVNTLSNEDNFYDSSDPNRELFGTYRIFVVRSAKNADNTTTTKYVNIGIYQGKYKQYNLGDIVTFNPGDGQQNFYVLKNSSSKEATVTLILDHNIGSVTNFNATGDIKAPTDALTVLKTNTNNWINTLPLNNFTNGFYTISYSGYHARLLEPNDIYTLLGNGISEGYFDKDKENLFDVEVDEKFNWLSANLTEQHIGYWMANTAWGSTEFAWTVQKDKMKAEYILSENKKIGVRPVIVVKKCASNTEVGCLK